MDDFPARRAEGEPAPPAATSCNPWANAMKTHDEKQKGCWECGYCIKNCSGRNARRVSSTAIACPWQY